MTRTPRLRTLREAVAYFSDAGRCFDFAVRLRWPGGVSCPVCGATDLLFLSTRRLWKCKREHPRQQFSVKVGTIFEDSPIGLDKWFAAIWMVANRPEDVTSHDIAHELDVTQKTAWFMIQRIQLAINAGSFALGADAGELERHARVVHLPEFTEGRGRA